MLNSRLSGQQRAVFHSWLGCNKSSHCTKHFTHRWCAKTAACLYSGWECFKHTPCIKMRNIHCHYNSGKVIGCRVDLWKMKSYHDNRRTSIYLHPSRTKTQHSEPKATNPLLQLQEFLPHPILEKQELIFTPSDTDVAKACELFEPSAKHKIQFVKGIYHPEQAPQYQLPEVAFIGRSNVGKSSLIKALFSNVEGLEIRTSKTPGHTKLVLFFKVGKAFSLVDMPGYGFRQPANFITSAEGFLKNRKNLRTTFLLLDSAVGLKHWDYVAIEMLEEFSIPYLAVLTKADKASKRQLIENILAVSKVIRENTQGCLPQPFLVSSKSGAGLPFLKAFIAYCTGNLELQES